MVLCSPLTYSSTLKYPLEGTVVTYNVFQEALTKYCTLGLAVSVEKGSPRDSQISAPPGEIYVAASSSQTTQPLLFGTQR